MKSFSFIHASDIHLGAHQFTNFDRADDFFDCFKEILEIAEKERVDFVIFGGDVFTSQELLPDRLMELINIIEMFQRNTENQVPIIAIEGNHDIRNYAYHQRLKRRKSWLQVLAKMKLIILLDAEFLNHVETQVKYTFYDKNKNSGGKIKIKDALIYGNHYAGQDPKELIKSAASQILKDKSVFNIFIQHFGIFGQMDKVPGVYRKNIACLRNKVDYLALGHFHKQYIIDDWIYNPGSSETASIVDNSYPRGIFSVNVTKDEKSPSGFKKKVRIIKLKNRDYYWKNIFIKRIYDTHQDFVENIINYLKSDEKLKLFNEKPVLSMVLKGKKPLYRKKIDDKSLKLEILKSFNVVDVKIYQKFNQDFKTLRNFI